MNQADTPLLRAVREELVARKGDWPRLVELTGVSQPTMSKIASGKVADPSVRAIERLGAIFGFRMTRAPARSVGRRARQRSVGAV